jgi:hypothetical protein
VYTIIMKFIITSILLCGLGISSQVFAQLSTFGTTVDASDIELIITPTYPEPFTTVSLRLLSNTVDLNRYKIDWQVNGELINSGIGIRDGQVTIGGYGSVTNITVSVNLGFNVIQKQITLSPQDSTVLWEAIDSYVPPFYRGKKMPSRESLVKITGIPHFQSLTGLTTGNAVYLWDRNGNRILNVGGYAKDSIIIEQNRLRTSELIKTTISSQDGRFTSEKSVVVPTVNPEIHWYAKNNQGYRKLTAINQGANISQETVTLVAEPYFFSTSSLQSLAFNWKVGGEQLYLDTDSPKHELLVRHPGGNGQVGFTLSIENPRTFLQTASNAVTLYFQRLNQ